MASKTKAAPTDALAQPAPGFLRRRRLAIMIAGPLALVAAIAVVWLLSLGSQTTEDAYVQAARMPVSAAVGGRIVEVAVAENQQVSKGQLLFRVSAKDYTASVEAAKARLADAQLKAQALSAAYRQQQLGVQALQNTVAFTAAEAARVERLVEAGVGSRQDLDRARHAADDARAQLAVMRQQAAVALANLGGRADAPDAYPAVLQARAELQRAANSLGDTEVYAPADGVVTRVAQLQVGAYVNPAQTLFWLVAGKPWVEANFKEDQLAKMRVGQPVEIRVDAMGSRRFEGHVESFSPGTGAAFSPLPAQNATGNWVKVVQRLPVRIAFDGEPPEMAGRMGLSAHVKVDVRGAEPL